MEGYHRIELVHLRGWTEVPVKETYKSTDERNKAAMQLY
jgi:hypothetical protein